MSDAPSTHETMPLVQSSGSLNNGDQQNLSSSGSKSSMTGQTLNASSNNSSGITIQNALPGSSSFVVGTKASQSIVTDTPVTDPGGSTSKQVWTIIKPQFIFGYTHYIVHVASAFTTWHSQHIFHEKHQSQWSSFCCHEFYRFFFSRLISFRLLCSWFRLIQTIWFSQCS